MADSLISLYKAHWQGLCALAAHIVHDREEAEDIVQEVFTSWAARDQTEPIADPAAYLYQATRFQCFKWLRHHKVRQQHLDRMDFAQMAHTTEDEIAASQLKIAIEEAIATLPDRPREIYLMSRHDNLSNKEIAERLQLKIETVENHLVRGMRALRAYLREMGY